MTTILEHLETDATLQVGRRRHYLRPDLSNTTVCGRFNLNAMTDRQLSRPVNPDAPICGVCDGSGQAAAAKRWGHQ